MTPPPNGRPTKVGGALALLAALVAAMAAVAFSTPGGLLALFGLALLLGGLVLVRLRLIDLGAATLAAAVLFAGWAGGTPLPVALGVVGAILAWDLGHNAASHGRQVGHTAVTGRAEGVHALGSVLAGFVATAIGVGIFTAASAGQPATAVALLALSGVVLVFALR